MKYDETTGLPELPSHMFWRISKDTTRHPRISIMGRHQERFFFFWKREVVSEHFYSWVFHGLTKENIRRGADTVMEKRREWLDTQANTSFYGDYPPKTLN